MALQPDHFPWSRHGGPQCGVQILRMDPHGNTLPHDHLFLELALIERGEAQHLTAAGTARIQSGQALLIRPQIWHGYADCRNLRVTNCIINTTLLPSLLPLLQSMPEADRLLRGRSSRPKKETPLVLTPPRGVFAQLRDTLESMLREQQAAAPGWQSVNYGLLLQALTLVVRSAIPGARKKSLSPAMAQAVQQAATIIENSYTHDQSLPLLAAAVGSSSAHLSRSFKRHMGVSLVDYVHLLRIEEACRLLRLTELPVSQIAAQVGYNEIAYFSRRFRRRIGRPPSEYRLA